MYIVSVLFSKQFCVWCLDHKSYNKCGCHGFSLCSPENYPNLLQLYLYYLLNYTLHCSGGSRGGAWGPGHPLFLDQTEAQRAEKNFIGELRTPPPPNISRSGAGTVLPTLIMSSAIYYLYLQVIFHEKDFLFRVSVIVLFVKHVSNLFQVTEALSLVIKLAEYLAKLPKVSVDLTIRQFITNYTELNNFLVFY